MKGLFCIKEEQLSSQAGDLVAKPHLLNSFCVGNRGWKFQIINYCIINNAA